jgi:hypothetical protein
VKTDHEKSASSAPRNVLPVKRWSDRIDQRAEDRGAPSILRLFRIVSGEIARC